LHNYTPDIDINRFQEIENINFSGNFKPLTKDIIKDKNLDIPSEKEIEDDVQLAINDFENKLKREFKDRKFNYSVKHQKFYVCPLYKLDFDYQGNNYSVYYFPSSDRVITTLPSNNTSQRLFKKARLPWNIFVYLIATITLIFPLLHYFYIQTQNLVIVDYIFAAIAFIVFMMDTTVVDTILNRNYVSREKNKIIQERKPFIKEKLNSFEFSYKEDEIKEEL
jgi:hypothetical protein